MPGGIGPIDRECARALSRNTREVRLPAAADELQIFYNLSMDRVHYSARRDAIYFVDSRHAGAQSIILDLLTSLGSEPTIERLHLDANGLLQGGKRLHLPPAQMASLLVALRLKGVPLSYSD